MTERPPDCRREDRPKPRAIGATALLCLVLASMLAIIQVAHIHPVESDPDHCPLCIAMHSAAPAAVVAAPVVLVQLEFAAPVYKARAAVRYWQPKLFTRPPPLG